MPEGSDPAMERVELAQQAEGDYQAEARFHQCADHQGLELQKQGPGFESLSANNADIKLSIF